MKRRTITISLLFILCSCFLNGQDTITTYYDRDWKKCNKDFAIYYRKAYPDNSSNMWIVKDYHMSGQLQMLGTYSDKKLKKQQGSATFYHHNGKLAQVGQYLDNKSVGVWKIYYVSGSIASEGKKIDGKNDSIWTYYHLNGSIKGTTNFVNGIREGESVWYYESGKICEKITYKNDKIKSKVNYDENCNVLKTVEKDRTVDFSGGIDNLFSYLSENIKYPEELAEKKIEGVVMLYFIVRKDGRIDNVEYKKSDEPLFNEEALRVFSLIKYMKPAREHGILVDRECSIPIVFRLYGELDIRRLIKKTNNP